MDTLLEWKNTMQGKSALLIGGARRTGKSTIAEEFARSESESCPSSTGRMPTIP